MGVSREEDYSQKRASARGPSFPNAIHLGNGHLWPSLYQVEEYGLMQQLFGASKLHRISMYADDVVLFLSPLAVDISTSMGILDLFGKASGLRNNEHKSNVYPI
jgi:hypothetical protein